MVSPTLAQYTFSSTTSTFAVASFVSGNSWNLIYFDALTVNNISGLTYTLGTGTFSIPSGTYIISFNLYTTTADTTRIIGMQSGPSSSPYANYALLDVMRCADGNGHTYEFSYVYQFTATTSFQLWTSSGVSNTISYLRPNMLQIARIV
jgi:hypothetical protein